MDYDQEIEKQKAQGVNEKFCEKCGGSLRNENFNTDESYEICTECGFVHH